MRRWWRRAVLVIAALSLAAVAHHVHKVNVQKQRDAHNQAELRKYSQNLNPGLSRKQVKDYLQAHRTVFGERCCYEQLDAFAVIVRVGEEDVPWYCSEWPDYVVFEFAPTEPHKWVPADSDVLKNVHLDSNGEGCL